MRAGRTILGLWLAAGLTAPVGGGEPPGLYRVELATGGDPLIAKLVVDEPEVLVLNIEGSIVRVEKKTIRKLDRISLHEDRSGKQPGQKKAAGKSASSSRKTGASGSKPKASSETALRDAIETLSSSDDSISGPAYRLLAGQVPAARPQLHRALRHNSTRVRTSVVKLLGEKGTVKDDLEPVAGSLKDEHPSVRRAAVGAVRILGTAGLPALVGYLETEADASNRKFAVQTLKIWNDERAVAPLVRLLSRERDNGVKNFAASALESLTGQNHGKNAAAWMAYLERKR